MEELKWAFTLWNKSNFEKNDYEILRRTGFAIAEISLDYPWPFSADFGEVMEKISTFGFSIAFHAPWRDIQLASPYRDISRGSLEVLKKVIDQVQIYQPIYMVIHLQTREEVDISEHYLEEIESTLVELRDYAKSRGVKILLENTIGGLTDSLDLYIDLLNRVSVGACLDVGRLLPRTPQESFSLSIIENWISTVGSKIEVLHLHTVGRRKGRITEHFPIIGAENLFTAIVKRTSFHNPNLAVTLEVFYTHTGNDVTASYLGEMLSRFLSFF